MDTKDERIRERAYRLWEQEGRPDGRAEAHWDAAQELVTIEDEENGQARAGQNPVSQGNQGSPAQDNRAQGTPSAATARRERG